MRSHVLLRLVGGKNCGSRCVLRPACVWKIWFWLLILLPAFLQVWNLPIVSVPWGIWSHWVLSLWNLEMWLCWNDEGDWWRGVLFFHFRVSPGYRRKYVSCLALSCLALSCLVAAAATAAGSAGSAGPAGPAGPAAAVAAAYLPTTELRAPQGAHAAVVTGRASGVATALRARPTLALSGMRAGRCANAPARHVPVMTGFAPWPWAYIGLRLCLAREACLFVRIASVLAPFGWSLRFDCSCGETCVPLRFATKSFKITYDCIDAASTIWFRILEP